MNYSERFMTQNIRFEAWSMEQCEMSDEKFHRIYARVRRLLIRSIDGVLIRT